MLEWLEGRPVLKFYKCWDDVLTPKVGTQGSACIDLYAYLKPPVVVPAWCPEDNSEIQLPIQQVDGKYGVWLPPRHRALIETGIIFDCPEGHSVRIHPRSGLSVKQGLSLANCCGILDSDFKEPAKQTVVSHTDCPLWIEDGSRIVQFELYRDMRPILEELDERPSRITERCGGFGHSGVA